MWVLIFRFFFSIYSENHDVQAVPFNFSRSSDTYYICDPSFNFMTDWTHFQSANSKTRCKKLCAVRLPLPTVASVVKSNVAWEEDSTFNQLKSAIKQHSPGLPCTTSECKKPMGTTWLMHVWFAHFCIWLWCLFIASSISLSQLRTCDWPRFPLMASFYAMQTFNWFEITVVTCNSSNEWIPPREKSAISKMSLEPALLLQ